MNAGPDQHFDVLSLDGVGREFSGVRALKDLDLEIHRGEFVSLLGPSGCGKSTALNCIAGLLQPTSGTISLDGRPIDHVPPEGRGFGMVFQTYALFPHLTVRDNVAFGLRMRGLNKADIGPRVDQVLARVQLSALGNRRPGQLSGGQQQRVAIARALVLEPQLMLMDEPLSNLDAKLRREMRTEIRRLHTDLGLTTIYVTHDQEEALSLSDRIVVLRDGVTQQVDPAQEVFTNPANAFVADFMGYRNSYEMNLTWRDGRPLLEGHGLQLEPAMGIELPAGRVEVRIRPDDLDPRTDQNPVEIICDLVEYQGKQFEVIGRLPGGTGILLQTTHLVTEGEAIRCGIQPDRVLVYPQARQEVRDVIGDASD